MIVRRLLTIPALFIFTGVVSVTLPAWLLIAWMLSWLPGWRGMLRSALFVFGYLWCESLGVVISFMIWVRHGFCGRNAATERWRRFLADNRELQFAWAGALKRLAEWLFELRFVVSGEAARAGNDVIFVLRHASLGDTVIPIVFYAVREHRALRYVLKRELLFDPCLDIVGNRLPNYFADRFSDDSTREVRGVVALLDELEPGEGVLIYPEGTRFGEAKREQILAKLTGEAHARARRWTRILPPRLGGVLGLLEHNPGLDLLFCAHVGFEGSSHFRTLRSGAWIGSVIRIHFWRVPYRDIPQGADAQRSFFLSAWDTMQATLDELAAT